MSSYYTSLSGLKAAQTELNTISNNVANVGTTGFKQSRAEFGDLIASSAFQAQSSVVGQGTELKSISQEFTQGSFETTDRALDLAVSGSGFFVTRGSISGADTAYTRNGAFTVDPDDYVTNASGGYLQVLPVDSQGNVTATGAGAISNLLLPPTNGTAKATGKIALAVSLPSAAAIPTDATFSPTDPNSYNQVSSTTVYDSAGNAIPASIYYARTSLPDANGASTWAAHLVVGDTEVSADPAAATQPASLTLGFDAAGTLITPSAATSFAPVTPTGAASALTLTVDFGTATRQADAGFTVASQSQDGNTVGKLSNVSVGTTGLVTASYSDGTTRALGKVALATFANPTGLAQSGDATWQVTGSSGEAKIVEAGTDGLGKIQSGALEQSNVDLTAELVALIAAQRNFQANAKAIDTSNQMTSVIVNMQS